MSVFSVLRRRILDSQLRYDPLKRYYFSPIIVILLTSLEGCDPPRREIILSDLDHQDLTIRIRAIKWAGINQNTAAMPQLVNLLQNEDQAVRYYSIVALRRITGTDHGYDFKADSRQRAEAVKRWREALERNNRTPENSSGNDYIP